MAAAVFGIAFAVYVATLSPTVFLIDSGPLTVAASSLGNAHPPGFPVYLILTHLATLLPFGSVALRANAASAFFAALACAMVSLAVGETLQGKAKRVAPAMFAGGLMLAFSRTLWAYATIAEVYALNTFLIAAIFWLVLRWRNTGAHRHLYVAALLFGLALGVHHLTATLAMIGVGVMVLRTGCSKKSLAMAAALALAMSVCVYAYLPIRASADPVLNWGDPDNVRDIVRHITAKMYHHYVSTAAQESQVRDLARLFWRELGPITLFVALSGLWFAFRRDRTLFWLLLPAIAASSVWMIFYPIADDEDAYLLPAFVALVISGGYAAGVAARKRSIVGLAVIVLPIAAAVMHWPFRDRSQFHVARNYALNTMSAMERDSILITGDRHLWGALLYVREVERFRTDVRPVFYGLLIRSWYIEQLERHQPEMMSAARIELSAYKPLLAIAENDAKRWKSDSSVREELHRRLDELVLALVARQLERGGHAYATYDVAMSQQEIDRDLVARLKTSYDLVPGGIALELLPGRRLRQVKAPPLDLSGLNDGSVRYEKNDVVVREIIPAYVIALRLRARYLMLSGQREAAAASYRDALRIDPDNADVQRELALATP